MFVFWKNAKKCRHKPKILILTLLHRKKSIRDFKISPKAPAQNQKPKHPIPSSPKTPTRLPQRFWNPRRAAITNQAMGGLIGFGIIEGLPTRLYVYQTTPRGNRRLHRPPDGYILSAIFNQPYPKPWPMRSSCPNGGPMGFETVTFILNRWTAWEA